MDEWMTRRRWIASCSVGVVASVAGCTGGDDASDEPGTDDASGGTRTSDGTSDGDSRTEANESENGGDGITIRHNTQTGRYVFEGSTGEDAGTETLVWDVQSIDGFDATVEGSFEGVLDSEEFSVIASPDAPEPTLFEPYLLNDDEDLSDYLSTRFIEGWFPTIMLGDIDLSSLSVGDEPDPSYAFGFNLEVTETRTYAGIECYVLEASLVGGGVENTYCVSPDHAMVISSRDHERGYEVELVEYEP